MCNCGGRRALHRKEEIQDKVSKNRNYVGSVLVCIFDCKIGRERETEIEKEREKEKTRKRCYTKTPLHTDTFTHRPFYIQKLLHTNTFAHRHFYTQTLLHTNIFTQRHFYTRILLHTNPFTSSTSKIALLPQFSRIDPHFVRKGCSRTNEIVKSQFYTSFCASNLISCERVAPGQTKL